MRTWKMVMVIIVMTSVAYYPVIGNDFILFDDETYVVENPHVNQGLSVPAIVWAFTHVHGANWHPITWISHMADCQMFGLNPAGHHAVNLIFHLINALLLFFFFAKITASSLPSAFLALVFGLHPMHVESVAWVAERKDLLSFFFMMLTCFAYRRYGENKTIRDYMTTLLFFMMGLLSKPMLVTLPVILLLFDYWPLKRYLDPPGAPSYGEKGFGRFFRKFFANRRLFIEKIPFFMVSLASSAITFVAQKTHGAVSDLMDIPLDLRLKNAVFSYLNYIFKLFFPLDLGILYPFPADVSGIKALFSLSVIGIITVFLFKKRNNAPYALFGWLWYLITLIPVIGIVQVGYQELADRYSYIPYVGLTMIFIWGAVWICESHPLLKSGVKGSAIGILLVLTYLTWCQAALWKNSESIFTHTLKVTSENPLMHHNLGVVLLRDKRFQEALFHFQEADRMAPNETKTLLNLGLTFWNLSDAEKALSFFHRALLIDPRNQRALTLIGDMHGEKGTPHEALDYYAQALEIDPCDRTTLNRMARLYYKEKRYEEVRRFSRKSLACHPAQPDLHLFLGKIEEELKSYDLAEVHYKSCLDIAPENEKAYCQLGILYGIREDRANSVRYFEKALSLKPDYDEARYNLMILLIQSKQLKEAEFHYQKLEQRLGQTEEGRERLHSIRPLFQEKSSGR